MSVKQIRDVLLGVTERVYHYKAPTDLSESYIVWGETGISVSFYADDESQHVIVSGELWYYTKTEYDPKFDEICVALKENGISWGSANVGYDDGTGRIVYSLSWSMADGAGTIYQ